MGVQWVLKTLGGTNLSVAGQYTTTLARHQMRLQTGGRTVTTAPRSELSPVYTGSTLEQRTITVQHEILGSGATHEANLAILKRAFYDPALGARSLVFAAHGVDQRATVVAARLLPHQSGAGLSVAIGEWVLLDQRYVADTATVVAPAAKSASPATVSLVNGGTSSSPSLTVTLKPTAAKAAGNGQRFGYHITPINRAPRQLQRWPVDLADSTRGSGTGGWNHAAEVTAGRSQSTGADVEVYVNGERVPRWFGTGAQGPANDAATAVWVNLDMPPRRTWTHSGSGSLTDAATSVPVLEELVGMPAVPYYAAFDNGATAEVVRVTAYSGQTLTIVRGQRGTTAVAWAAGSTLYWTPVLVDLVYGGTSVPAPEYIDARQRPLVLENTAARSSNYAHRYTRFQQTAAAADTQGRLPRGGTWRTRMAADLERDAREGDGDLYVRYLPRTATLATDAALASAMCLAYRSDGALAGHPLTDRWELDSPIGIATVVYDIDTLTLDYAGGFEARAEVVAVDIDGNEEVLARHDGTDLSAQSASPTAPAYVLWYRIDPFDPKVEYPTVDLLAQEPTAADGMVVENVTVVFAAADELVMAWGGARRDIYQLGRPDAPATLATSSGTLSIRGLVLDLDDTITLDVEGRSATVGDGTGRAHLLRGAWPWVPIGTTNLTYTETGIGEVTIGATHRSAWV